MFREATDRTAALLSNLARLSEDMSAEERRIAESFIERVLKLANVETGIASDLITAGTQRIQQGNTENDAQTLALGYLVHAIGLLSSGDIQGARTDLGEADLLGIDALQPYVHWAWSLSYRVERDIENALKETFFAFEYAEFTEFDKADLDLMVKHLLALWELADANLRTAFREPLETLQKRTLVERFAALFPR